MTTTQTPSRADEATVTESRPWLLIALVAVLLISLVLVGVLAWRTVAGERTSTLQADATAAARQDIPRLLTFDPKNLTGQIAQAHSLISGSFAGSYGQMLDGVVSPQVQRGMQLKADVVRAAATEDISGDNVQVLMFVRQTTTLGGQPPSVALNQLRVMMTRADGRWLVSAMQPI